MPKPPSITRIGLRGREFLAVEVGGTEHLRGPFCVKDFSDSIFPDQNFVSLALAHAEWTSAWRVRPEKKGVGRSSFTNSTAAGQKVSTRSRLSWLVLLGASPRLADPLQHPTEAVWCFGGRATPARTQHAGTYTVGYEMSVQW